MDAESLREILKLKEENTLLKRGILEICVMIHWQKIYPLPEFDIEEVKTLYIFAKNLINQVEKEKAQDELDKNESLSEIEKACEKLRGIAVSMKSAKDAIDE